MKPLLLSVSLVALCGISVAQTAPVMPVEVSVDSGAILASVLLERIGQGQTTAEAAWQNGELNEAMLLFLLNQPSGDRTGESLLDKAGQSEAFVEVLIGHLPEKVSAENVAKLGEGARYRVADYWFKRGDERALPLLQELVEAGAAQFKAQGRLPWFYDPSVTRVGEWYQANGRGQQGLELLDGAAKLSNNPSYRADWLLLSGRIAAQMGDGEKARGYYQQIAKWGQAWFTGLASWDQASAMMANGQQEQARQLLQTSLKSEGTDQINVVLRETLAESYYLSGDAQAAREHAQKSLQTFQTLGSPRASVQEFAERTENILAWLDLWQKTPLIGLPRRLRVVERPDEPVGARLSVRSLGNAPLTATSDNPQIQVLVEPEGDWSEFYFARGVLVRRAPDTKSGDFDAVLTISSAKYPNFALKVPVHLEASQTKPDAN